MKKPIKVLFVCLGNICRSPTAEGVFQHLLEQQQLNQQITCDSAGTSAHHIGESPDHRSQQIAKLNGVDLSYIRSRQLKFSDYYDFDYILAMDESNFKDIHKIAPKDKTADIQLFLQYHPDATLLSVPDPYYGGDKGFVEVFDMLQVASKNFVKKLEKKLTDIKNQVNTL